MTRTLLSIFAVAVVLSWTTSASATLIYYDSFGYASTGSLGTAGAANWTKQGASNDPTVQNIGGLSYPGLAVSNDTNSLQYDGSGVNPGNGAPAATDSTQLAGQPYTTGTLYYSLLLKVPAVQTTGGNGFTTGVNLTSGSFMAGLQTVVAGTAPTVAQSAAPLLITSGDGVSQFSTTFRLGTSKTATSADRQFAPTQFTTGPDGQTVFAVLEYTFDSVNGDSAKLFLNPTPGGSEPAPDLNVTAGANLTLNTGIQSFFVRNNSVEPDNLLIDELRIGTTWEDVTPAVPEPATGVLTLLGLSLLCLRRRGR